MSPDMAKTSILNYLVVRDLAGITFVRGYMQFLFDGPFLNAYTHPRVKTAERVLDHGTPGYCDALCGFIGKRVTATREEPNTGIFVQFADGTYIEISLRDEDRVGAEAAMFQTASRSEWNVW
jgi:hypothetical protein